MKARGIAALPALVGVLALGSAAHAWPLALVLGISIVLLAFTGPRLG